MTLYKIVGNCSVYHGDNRDVLKTFPDNSIDSVVTDPPYALVSIVKRFGGPNAAPAKGNDAYARAARGFMGKQWDTGEVAFSEEFWAEVLRVLKPGGHVAAFGASRGYHRMACAIEDAGFEIRDSLLDLVQQDETVATFLNSLNDEQREAFARTFEASQFGGTLAWIYGTGFPKSQNVAKFIDKELGVKGALGGPRSAAHAAMLEAGVVRRGEKHEGWDRPWMDDPEAIAAAQSTYIPGSPEAQKYNGYGTALKPAFEPIVLARKPLSESTVAANVLRWGTGALNIDGCRIDACGEDQRRPSSGGDNGLSGTSTFKIRARSIDEQKVQGRWPANICHDGSEEVVGAFAAYGEAKPKAARSGTKGGNAIHGGGCSPDHVGHWPADNGGSAARFFFNTMETDDQWLARNLPRNHAKPAENCFNLSSELAVSVLRNAADLSTLELVPRKTDSAAPSMSATPSELRLISGTLIETMQSFERKSSLEVLQERLSLSGNPANFVATKKPTGIITITISLSKSDGSVEHVTYNIMPMNSELGVKDCAQSTARFHYSAKASKQDRNGSKHPTVKPIALMQWLARLITPPGGTVLDPFAGSGTTGAACEREGFRCVLVEREAGYVQDIVRRLSAIKDHSEKNRVDNDQPQFEMDI